MAAAMHHVSMLPTIKCSNCGMELEISMVGEHTCTDKQPSDISVEPVAASNPFAPPKHSSPLQQVVFSDNGPRSRSPSPVPSDGVRSKTHPKPPAIDLAAANHSSSQPTGPLTPAESLTAPDISPSSSTTSSGGRSSPFLEPPQNAAVPQPLTPHSGSQATTQSRPSSPDLFSNHAPNMRKHSYSTTQTLSRPRSPLSQHTTLAEPEPQVSAAAPLPLRVNIPPHARQTSAGSIVTTSVERHRKTPSMDRSKRQSGNAPEEKKILGLFRRKSSKSISKRDVSSPIMGPNDRVPAIPGLPIAQAQSNMPLTPVTPGPLTPGFDRSGKTLPSGPAPPRPARPESINDVADRMDGAPSVPSRPQLSRNPSAPPALPPPPQPYLPDVTHAPRGRPVEDQQPKRNSDASFYTDANPSPERPSQLASGLPQISEEEDAPLSARDPNPPPSAWPGDRLRASSGSRHAPSESTSSNGSRFGFDERSTSSISSPPTSSASSFQFSPEESRTVHSFASESSSASPKIGTSPRTANFSRPRAPTTNSPPSSHGTFLSPMLGGASTAMESPSEPATPGERHFEPLKPQSVQQPSSQPMSQPGPAPIQSQQPTLQAVSYQRHAQLSKALPSTFVRPPMPPMPEEPTVAPAARPTISRSRSTASKGQCRGCKHDITGRSVKAADGRLTGRWHKECFVCKTCRTPFQTADFYVLRDEPYCSHHYHVLNNSLCRHCHTGIEGRYFEIDGRRRFHTGCFACADCQRPLAGDYFEMANRFYCEIDAQRFHQKTHHLNPGRRFPERRTTKLMEM